MSINLIITIAGKSSRFSRVGISTPKWALPYRNSNVLAAIAESYEALNPRLFIYCRSEHVDTVEDCFEKGPNRPNFKITDVAKTPFGQAQSAADCIIRNNLVDEQVLIVPGDMIFTNIESDVTDFAKCWIAVSKLAGNQWSFAKLSDKGLIVETAEKNRISEWASVGLYNFQAGSQLLNAIDRNQTLAGELYIAPLYNHLISDGIDVVPMEIDPAHVIDLGTPESYFLSSKIVD